MMVFPALSLVNKRQSTGWLYVRRTQGLLAWSVTAQETSGVGQPISCRTDSVVVDWIL